MGFPRQVNVQAAPAVAGDFCDANPRSVVDAGQGGFVAGSSGLTIGSFAWADTLTNKIANSFGAGAPAGFHLLSSLIWFSPTLLAASPGFAGIELLYEL